MKKIVKRMVFALLLIIIGLYIVVSVALFTQQRRMLYPISMTRKVDAALKKPDLTLLKKTLTQGQVDAYYWKAVAQPSKGLVVYFHGNGTIAEDALMAAQHYRRRGYDILVPEYRGYGRSAGHPTQKDITQDVIDFIKQVNHTGPLIFHGYSLGGGVACSVAKHQRPDGLILQSTFTSIKDFAKKMGMMPFLVKDPYDTRTFLTSYAGPVLIIHGKRDRVVPFDHGVALSKLSSAFQFFPHNGTHSSVTNESGIQLAIKLHLQTIQKAAKQ